MATNNDLGSLSYSLNIDISQLPDTIREVEKKLSAITTIADISTRVNSDKLISSIRQALAAEDFKLKVTLDESFRDAIINATSLLNRATNSTGGDNTNTQLGYIDSLIFKLKELEAQYKALPKGADTSGLISEFRSVQAELDKAGKNLSSAFNKSWAEVSKMSETTISDIKSKIKSLEQYKLNIPIANKSEIEAVNRLITKLKGDIDALKPTAVPKNFADVMGMDTATLNQISDKLREIRKLRGDININNPDGLTQINSLNKAEADLLRLQQQRLGVQQQINQSYVEQTNIVEKLSGAALAYFSTQKIAEFTARIRDTRGEFEKQQIALQTILRDKDQADKLFSQVVDLGLKSPFSIMELNNYVKQLSAYRIETEDLFDTTKRLADISAGLGVQMNRLILAYGQVKAASVLRGQEVRQFTEAGIPLIEALAEQFTKLEGRVVSTSEVFDKISNRLVPFEMVRDVLFEMTDAGGMFFNMQERLSEGVAAKWKNLQDALDLMYNSIGTETEDFMKGAIDGLVALTENWEALVDIVIGATSAFGAYRAITLLTNSALAIQSGMIARITTATSYRLAVTKLLTAAEAKLSAVMAANPYGIAAAAIVGLGYAIYKATTYTTELDKAVQDFDKTLASEKMTLDALIERFNSLEKGTESYNKTRDLLQEKYKEALKSMNLEVDALHRSKENYALLSAEIEKNTKAKLRNKYADQFASESGEEVAKMYKDIRKRIKSQKGGASDAIFESVKQIIESSDITTSGLDFTKQFKTLGLEWRDYSKDVYSLLSSQYRFKEDLKELDAIFGTSAKEETGDAEETFRSLADQIDEARKNVVKLKKELKDLRSGTTPSNTYAVDIEAKEKELGTAQKRLDTLLGTNPKGGSKAEDPTLKKYRDQIALVKEANKAYEDNLKNFGKENAKSNIVTDYGQQFEELGIDVEYATNQLGFFNDLKNKLSKDKSAKGITLYNEVNKTIAGVNSEDRTKSKEKTWHELNDEAKKAEKAYALLESLKGKLDEDLAKKLVSSLYEGISLEFSSFNDFIKDKISDGSGDWGSQAGINFKENFYKESKESFIKLLTDFQTVEDKITAIQTKYNKDLDDLASNKDSLSPERYNKMVDLIKERMANEIAALTEGLLEMSDTYQRLFSGITELSEKELNYLIQKFKKALEDANNAGKKEDGLFHIYLDGEEFTATEKRMATFKKGLDKQEADLRKRNPFKALADSFNKLKTNLGEQKDLNNQISNVQREIDAAITEGKPQDEIDTLKKKLDDLKKKLAGVEAENASTWLQMSSDIDKVNSTIQNVGSSVVSLFEAFGASEDTTQTLNDIMGLVGGLGDTASGIARIAGGDVIGGLTQGIKGVASLVSSIDSLFWDDGVKEYEKAVAVYERMEDVLSRVIDRQKELIGISVGSQSADYFKNSIEAIEKQLDYGKKVLDKFMDSGGGMFSHSKGYRENRYIKKWQDQLKSNGFDIKSWEDLYKLSADQIYKLQETVPEFYAGLFDETKDYLQMVVDKEEELIELTELYKESLTGLSFDTLLNSLDGLLQSSDTVFSEIGESFDDNMRNAVLNFVKNKYLRDALTKWYDQFADYYKDDELSSSEVDTLRQIYEEMYNKAQEMYDSALGVAGVSKKSKELSGLSKGIQGLTEDTAQIIEAYLNTMRDMTISIKMNGEMQLSILESSQIIQSNMLTQLSMINSTTVQISTAIRSALAQSGGDDGPGFRVYVKS